LFDLAVSHGLKPPQKLEEWIDFDQGAFAANSPWLTNKQKKLLNVLYISTLFIDNKIASLFTSNSLKYKFLRFAAFLYRPLAKLRLKHHLTIFFLEGWFRPIIK
jgi:hypothetical protein